MMAETVYIINAIKAVPYGRVASYRDIGLVAGLANGARQVARVLHSLSRSQQLPWHRIIRANGHIALLEGNGRELQIALLRSEGVKVSARGVVDYGRYAWFGSSPDALSPFQAP
ncbi:MAG: MGMT family protein [Treponema sp.]|nr:MGMT family protein [Treponema sp.]